MNAICIESSVGGLPSICVITSSSASPAFAPGLLHATRATSQPPTTADCESAFQVACYEPGQIQTAYNLEHGITPTGISSPGPQTSSTVGVVSLK